MTASPAHRGRLQPDAQLPIKTTAFALLPVSGDTPIPWRRRPGLFVSSPAQHALHAGTVVGVSAAILRGRSHVSSPAGVY